MDKICCGLGLLTLPRSPPGSHLASGHDFLWQIFCQRLLCDCAAPGRFCQRYSSAGVAGDLCQRKSVKADTEPASRYLPEIISRCAAGDLQEIKKGANDSLSNFTKHNVMTQNLYNIVNVFDIIK